MRSVGHGILHIDWVECLFSALIGENKDTCVHIRTYLLHTVNTVRHSWQLNSNVQRKTVNNDLFKSYDFNHSHYCTCRIAEIHIG
jgi:hypothetical protein